MCLSHSGQRVSGYDSRISESSAVDLLLTFSVRLSILGGSKSISSMMA
jgi:hypothetical protein